mmetsp:Transcript_24660/g.37475  ORF Transcript_24660/g.37475 Transcript_24660/m.37475 type:complete len:83 (+) Transcript_24660:454-702(+)
MVYQSVEKKQKESGGDGSVVYCWFLFRITWGGIPPDQIGWNCKEFEVSLGTTYSPFLSGDQWTNKRQQEQWCLVRATHCQHH